MIYLDQNLKIVA